MLVISILHITFYFFLPIKDIYLDDPSLEIFYIQNFKNGKINKIKEGLEDEIIRRNDSDINNVLNLPAIDSFLSRVVFIIDRCQKADYINRLLNSKTLIT